LKYFDIFLVARYALVGILTFSIYTIFLYIELEYFNTDYILAVGIAYILAIFFHFLGNRYYSFKATHEVVHTQFFRYAVITVSNFFIQIFVASILENMNFMNRYIDAYIGIAIIVIIGFLASNFWIFKRRLDDNCA